MTNVRRDRLASVMQRSLQRVISRGLQDPRVRGLITVTRIELHEDLKSASVYVTVLPDEHERLSLHGLQHAAKHLRHQIADDLAIPNTPHLNFRIDTPAKAQAGVLAAIAKAAAELPTESPEETPTENPTSDSPTRTDPDKPPTT